VVIFAKWSNIANAISLNAKICFFFFNQPTKKTIDQNKQVFFWLFVESEKKNLIFFFIECLEEE
jgi:hypothetical protein